MRGQALIDHVTEVIEGAFDDDVAQALLANQDTLENLARHLNRTYGDDGMAAAVEHVAKNLDDDTADWLAEEAQNPTAWLYNRV